MNDVTLRDGEQAPGNTMTVLECLEIAHLLAAMGINGIEAGFPAASEKDREAVSRIAKEVGTLILPSTAGAIIHPRISGLARLVRADIDHVLQCVAPAPHRGVHTFISTSQAQLCKFDDRMQTMGLKTGNMQQFIDRIVLPDLQLIGDARKKDPNIVVQFSLEDFTRTDMEVAKTIILEAVKQGAMIINLPDTVGNENPFRAYERVKAIRKFLDTKGHKDVTISWHGHNDSGCGVANAEAALLASARQFEPTILGIGERTGNFSFEGFIAAIDGHRESIENRIGKVNDSIVRFTKSKKGSPECLMLSTAQRVADILRRPIPHEHPIVGANAFAHESGIHQAGAAKGDRVYSGLDPKDYGIEHTFPLGKGSGWTGIKKALDRAKIPYREKDRTIFTKHLKEAAGQRRKGLSPSEAVTQVFYPAVIEITGGPFVKSMRSSMSDDGRKKVTVEHGDRVTGDYEFYVLRLQVEGIAQTATEGAINAAMQALKDVMPDIDITGFTERMSDPHDGSAAAAIADVTISNGKHAVTMSGIAEDIEVAALNALQQAFNALYALREYSLIDEPIQRGSGIGGIGDNWQEYRKGH